MACPISETCRSMLLCYSRFSQDGHGNTTLTRPATPHSLWREKAFDVTLDGQWISGVFDRVIIFRNDAGEARRAAIYDFKTDEGEIAETYRGQMSLYLTSLSFLIGLPAQKITCSLISVRTGGEIPVLGHTLVQGVFDLV